MNNLNLTPIYKTDLVKSKDGTIINYQIMGNGPGLLLIPGVLALARDYNDLADTLAKSFTVYSIDRRGHGFSGPQGEDYSIKKECEDIEALIMRTKAPYIFGHSYGGLVALEVSRNNPLIKKVAIYEAAVCIDNSISIEWIPAYQKSLDKGKYLEAFSIFSTGAGPRKAQRVPLWMMKLLLPLFIKKYELKEKYKLLSQNLMEHRVVVQQNNSFKNYKEINAGVLIMSGQKTGISWLNRSLKELKEVLPYSKSIQFPTLDHFGPEKRGSAEVAKALINFFSKKEPCI